MLFLRAGTLWFNKRSMMDFSVVGQIAYSQQSLTGKSYIT
jgi:hypothetical protein